LLLTFLPEIGLLCRSCRRIRFEYTGSVIQLFKAKEFKLGTIKSTLDSARLGCNFCAFIVAAFDFYRPVNCSSPLTDYRLSISVKGQPVNILNCIAVGKDGFSRTAKLSLSYTPGKPILAVVEAV
jgi:hypothetical protein